MPSPFHGALPTDDGTLFRVWAPEAGSVTLVRDGEPPVPLTAVPDDPGVFETRVEAPAGTRYWIEKDGTHQFPDPASRAQPDGVHGPSEVVDPAAYAWGDGNWTGRDRAELVIYELHVGTFTQAGTFDAARERLEDLADLGVTAVELMPVHAFPGTRNWGYDPAAFFAPPAAYGPPDALRRFVDHAHQCGLAVLIDVIYNHLGPDGAYANAFAPFLTDAYETPWGRAINLDDDGSHGVRRFFIDNALHWLREYHADGLRIDATHALRDASSPHFLAELSAAVDAHVGTEMGDFPRHLIAEDHRNLNRLVLPRDADADASNESPGGYGLDAVWSDDFHHQIRTLTAGDTAGYYADFAGTTTADVATTIRDGWFFRGQYAEYFDEHRGTDPDPVALDQCVVFIQNHDQVGNRPLGDRLTESVSLPVYRAVSALLCCLPEIPLLFMGQEWAASTPFQFFTDHTDEIGPTVTEGRKTEFEDFPGFDGDVPDPQAPATFERSVLDWSEAAEPPHAAVRRLYRDLLQIRPTLGAPADATAEAPSADTLVLHRPPHHLLVALTAARVPDVSGADVLLHTEALTYTSDPAPPTRDGDTVRFERAGAVLLREEGGGV
jgi:maltooligosyltrehalose trehalohydrolase